MIVCLSDGFFSFHLNSLFPQQWHLGHSRVERFTCDGRIIPIKHCVNADGHWKPEYQRRNSSSMSASKTAARVARVENKPPKAKESRVRYKCPFPGCQKDG